MGTKNQQLYSIESCVCFSIPHQTLSNYRELGMDRGFAEDACSEIGGERPLSLVAWASL
jgi:hypothetical protein